MICKACRDADHMKCRAIRISAGIVIIEQEKTWCDCAHRPRPAVAP